MWKIAFCFVLSCAVGCASFEPTPNDLLSSPVNYVYDVPMSKGEIYDKALMWVANTYGSANAVIQFKDRNAGKIIGKGIGKAYLNLFDRGFNYTFNVDTKDRKVRIAFTNLSRHDLPGSDGMVYGLDVTYLDQWNLAKTELDRIAKSLNQYLTKKTDDF